MRPSAARLVQATDGTTPRMGYARSMPTGRNEVLGRRPKAAPAAGHDRSGLKSRMEGVKLPGDAVLAELQRLARSRVIEEVPRRFSLRRR